MGMSMPSGGGRRQRYRQPPVAEINITPFVDVVLVLLIVFMISAPMMTQGVDVSLPKVENAPLEQAEEPLTVFIKNGGEVFVQNKQVPMNKLVSTLKAITGEKPNPVVLVRADKGVSYGRVMAVMSALQSSGLTNVGLVTLPVGSV